MGGDYMNPKYTIAIIADIHFGAMDSKRLMFELYDQFLSKLEDLPALHAIVIAGDFYDHKLSMNSPHAKASIYFIEKLMLLAKEKSSSIRIIKGTESHDNKQLELLTNIFNMSDEVDARVISTVESEVLFPNCEVLYLPEEYIDDPHYYDPYFIRSYDMVFGHGMFTEVSFGKRQDGEINHPKAPIFNSTEIGSLCEGPVFFGHIHTRQVLKGKVYYVGSFSRWCFGEDADKGFYICNYSRDGYDVEFVKNKMTLRYDTIVVDFNDSLIDESMETIFGFIDLESLDHLRLIINIPPEFENPLMFTNMVNDYFSKVDNVKVIVNNSDRLHQKKVMEEKLDILMGKYGFVFDKTISYEEKIYRLIKEKYKKNIPIEKIHYYLYEQMLK
jgi:DNA repair exonuclease SbcCD nuclease subunit